MADHYHNHEDNSWVGVALLFAAVLIVVLLAILAKIFIFVGILGIVIGIIVIIVGINNEEGVIIFRGIIILVTGILLIFLGSWISSFLVDIGAIDFASNTIQAVNPN